MVLERQIVSPVHHYKQLESVEWIKREAHNKYHHVIYVENQNQPVAILTSILPLPVQHYRENYSESALYYDQG